MTLSQFILYPLTHRMVTEHTITEYERGLAALAEYIERHSAARLLAAPAPVKATRDRKVPRKARRHLIAAE